MTSIFGESNNSSLVLLHLFSKGFFNTFGEYVLTFIGGDPFFWGLVLVESEEFVCVAGRCEGVSAITTSLHCRKIANLPSYLMKHPLCFQ
jgi:hypothetical protein